MAMTEAVTALLVLLGSTLMFVAGLGITRMPDLFLRMSATTKVATLGLGSIMLAVILFFDDTVATSHAVVTILFVFVSAPVAAHVIGRAAYFNNVPLWEGTVIDQLRGQYDIGTHQLASIPLPELEQELSDVRMRKFPVSRGSPIAGRTLAQIGLRRDYDVSVLVIRRDAVVIPNPAGDAQILPGDELIVMGLPAKLAEVESLFLRPAAPRTGDAAPDEESDR